MSWSKVVVTASSRSWLRVNLTALALPMLSARRNPMLRVAPRRKNPGIGRPLLDPLMWQVNWFIDRSKSSRSVNGEV
jgi:hypothetical protein